MRELSYTGLRHADDRGQVIVSREKYIYIYTDTSISLSLCIYCMLYANIFVYIYICLFIYICIYVHKDLGHKTPTARKTGKHANMF